MAEAITAGQTRAENVRRERRMKPGAVSANGIKLAVDHDKLDPKKHHRWVREERVPQMIAADYDPVTQPAKADGTGLGSVPTQHGGVDDAGKPYGMVLMGKYQDWFDADQAAKQARLNEKDEQIRRGLNTDPEAQKLGTTYTPNGVNIIDKL